MNSAVATPDLWDQIALRLPAEDARKTQEREQSARGWLSWLTGVDGRMALARPLGAVAVAAGAVAVAALAEPHAEQPRCQKVIRSKGTLVRNMGRFLRI